MCKVAQTYDLKGEIRVKHRKTEGNYWQKVPTVARHGDLASKTCGTYGDLSGMHIEK